VNRGPFLEGLNWATIYRLPVLFVCEDNRYSATTPTAAMTGGDGAAARAAAIGVPGRAVDGNDVEAIDAAARALAAEIRGGAGPRFLHAITYRVKGHVSVDAAVYREADEVARALEQDPLRAAGERLAALGTAEEMLVRIRAEADAEIARAVAAAHAAAWPEVGEAYRDVQDIGAGRWY
jgi:pyruvate dehydrogenase E1 component alpha subunit